MNKTSPTMAERVAQAASAFEKQRTGRTPRSVNVILSDDTLVITLQGVVSPVEKELSKHPARAAELQEFHRRLFAVSADSLRLEIKTITGVAVREATMHVEGATGAFAQMSATGAVVQVFLLERSVPGDAWNGSESGQRS